MNNINIKTGEIITQNSPLAIKSEALRLVSLKLKELQEIEKALKSLVEAEINKAIECEEKELADYWIVNNGRLTFDSERFKKKASKKTQEEYKELKKRIKDIESKFLKVGKPFLSHPRL